MGDLTTGVDPLELAQPGFRMGVPVGHSAGPWHVADHGSGLGVRDALGRRIASLRYAGSSVSARVPSVENYSNARLMVAAPEMREALEAIAGMLETDKSNDWSDELAEIRRVLALAVEV